MQGRLSGGDVRSLAVGKAATGISISTQSDSIMPPLTFALTNHSYNGEVLS